MQEFITANADTVIIALGLLSLALVTWIIYLEIRLKKLLRGRNATSLEDTIVNLGQEIEKFHNRHHTLDEYLKHVEKRVTRSVQQIGTVRFNPFPDKGGNQSFAAAFLDEQGNGLVISSLAAREKVNVFAKPIERFVSSYELSDEEQEAIAKARNAS